MLHSAADLETRLATKLANPERLPSYKEALCTLLSFGIATRELQPYNGGSLIVPCSTMAPLGVFTILTQEFVGGLYKELKRRRLASLPVLEICAGRGLLSHNLRKLGMEAVATDDYSADMPRNPAIVEQLTHRQALEKYRPRFVLGSWLPAKEHIGDDVLNFPSVDYFIVIGESPGGATWPPKGYQNHGFKVYNLADISKYALGSSDYFSVKGNESKLALHTSIRLYKRKGTPMSIDHAVG